MVLLYVLVIPSSLMATRTGSDSVGQQTVINDCLNRDEISFSVDNGSNQRHPQWGQWTMDPRSCSSKYPCATLKVLHSNMGAALPTYAIPQFAICGSCTKNTIEMEGQLPLPPSPDSDDHSAEMPSTTATHHAASQPSLHASPSASSSHGAPSLVASAPATVTPDTTISTPESPVIRLQQVAPPIDRWEVPPSAKITCSSSPERLGDHGATRYRHFRQFIESQHGEKLDNVLFSMLLSGESLCDEIRAFEKASSLVRLAQTGYLVHKLRQLHELLDSVALTCALDESEDLSNWETALEAERADRVERYDVLLRVRLGDDEEEGDTDVAVNYYDLDEWDLMNETFVQEVLTMLMAGVHKYAHDVLTQQETRVIMAAFEAVSIHSNTIVMTTLEWFVSPFEFGGTYGLGRWGNDLLHAEYNDRERFVVEANIWSRLNHPHIAKFLGACHVGSRPFFAHEKVRTMTEYLGGLKVTDRQAVWCRLYELALGVRYVHERGFGCGELCLSSVYCARFEDKTLLLGIGLVKSMTEPGDVGVECGVGSNSLCKLVRADIRSLFLCILDALSVLASSHKVQARKIDAGTNPMRVLSARSLPTSRPEFVTESEWKVLQSMLKSESEVNMLVVLDRLGGLAGNEEQDAFEDMSSIDKQLGKQVIDLGDIVVLSNGMTLREVLEQCERLVAREPSCAQIHARLSNVLDELHQHDLSGMDRNEAKDMVGHMCDLVVRFYRFLYQKSTSVASSLAGWNRREPAALFSFHTGIDNWIKQYGKSMKLNPIHDWQLSWHQLLSSRQSLRVQSRSAVVAQSNDDEEEEEVYCEFERMQHSAAYIMETNSRISSAHTEPHEPHIDIPKQSLLPKWLIPPYEVVFREFDAFAEGAFGAVHRGKWFETPVIVKRVFTDKMDKRVVQQQFRREADIWFGLNHINVIKMYGACHVGQPFFVCEYASGGELMPFLKREGRNHYLMWYCLLNAALGLQYLHDAGVVHGDLKANNILVGADGNVKLADFGLSLSTSVRSSQDAAGGGAVGAYRWKAPECIPYKDDPGRSPTFASDMFSFAMCIIEVVSGEFPWETIADAAVKFQVKRGQLPKRPNNMGDAEWNLIERMCCFDPTKRVSSGSVVSHLSGLLQRMNMEQLWPSIEEKIPFNNRVMSRDGALLSLLRLATSTSKIFSKLAEDHLLAVHINRGAQSGIHELELIVEMLQSDSSNVKSWAARAIEILCWRNDENSMRIAAFGAVPIVVNMICDGNDVVKHCAAGALANLAVNPDNMVSIASAGGIPLLLDMVRVGSEVAKREAARALINLSVNDDNEVSIVSLDGIPMLLDLIRNGNEVTKEYAAHALANLSVKNGNMVSIASLDGIPLLLDLIRDGNEVAKREAARALSNLSMNDDNKMSVASLGGIPLLLDLIRDGNEVAKREAARALSNLSMNDDNKMSVASLGGIPLLLDLIRDGNELAKPEVARALLNLSVSAENMVSIASANGIRLLLDLIRDGNEDVRVDAVRALGNLSVNDDNKVSIASEGSIPLLLDLIRDGNEDVKEDAARVLGTLAVNANNNVSIASLGGIPLLLDLIRNGNEVGKLEAVRALANLSVNDDNKVSIASADGIFLLLNLIRGGNEVTKERAARSLHCLSNKDNNWVAIAATGGIPFLLDMIHDGNEHQIEFASHALHNFLQNECTISIASAGGFPVLMGLNRDNNDIAKEYAARALANLSMNDGNMESIASLGGIPILLALIRDGNEFAKEYAAHSLANLSVNDDNKVSIASEGGIPLLLNLMYSGNENAKEHARRVLSYYIDNTDTTALCSSWYNSCGSCAIS